MAGGSNTANNSGGATGKPFVKGDPRINRKGRPKTFDAWRALSLSIAHEVAQTKDKETGDVIPVVIDEHLATNAEVVLRNWWRSHNPKLQMYAAEVAFGKVPQPVEHSGKDGGPLQIVTRVVRADGE